MIKLYKTRVFDGIPPSGLISYKSRGYRKAICLDVVYKTLDVRIRLYYGSTVR